MYENLTENSDDIFRVIRKLWERGSIMKASIDPKTGRYKNDPDYDLCVTYEEYIKNYLAVTHFLLTRDVDNSVYYITNDAIKGEALNKETTYILLILQLIYNDKMQEMTPDNIWTTKLEIREKGAACGLLSDTKISGVTWAEIFRLFKQKNILSFSGAASDVRDDTKLFIYPTINIFTSPTRYTELIQMTENGKGSTSGGENTQG